MRLIKLESFPNREMRLTTCHEPHSRRETSESHNETELILGEENPPPCHPLKTLKGQSGDSDGEALVVSLPVGYGSLGRQSSFSNYGRRQMLRAGGALESIAPCQECLFLTATLPGSTSAALKVLAQWSSFAVQRLKAWLGLRIKNNFSMYSWEWQKRGALHLHYVVHCSDRGVGEYIRKNIREQWCRILDAISEASKVDLYQQSNQHSWKYTKEIVKVDAQWCKKSVAAYISKYVSKSSLEKRFSSRRFFAPARWYGVSRPLLARLRELTQTYVLSSVKRRDAERCYEDSLWVLQSMALKSYTYRHKVGDGKTIVAYVDNEQREAVWKSLLMTANFNQPLSVKSDWSPQDALRQGVYLMRKYWQFRKTFSSLSPNYVKNLLVKFDTCQQITSLDQEFLLETLAYCSYWASETYQGLPVECIRWQNTTETQLRMTRENRSIRPFDHSPIPPPACAIDGRTSAV